MDVVALTAALAAGGIAGLVLAARRLDRGADPRWALTLLLLPIAGSLRRESRTLLAAAASAAVLILVGRVLYLAAGLSEALEL